MQEEKLNTNIIPKSSVEYVIIAVCTYKRSAELERLLNNLLMLNYFTKMIYYFGKLCGTLCYAEGYNYYGK